MLLLILKIFSTDNWRKTYDYGYLTVLSILLNSAQPKYKSDKL